MANLPPLRQRYVGGAASLLWRIQPPGEPPMAFSSTQNIAQIQAEAGEEGAHTLKRTLSATNLVMLGIGAIIGAGIFVLPGTAAANNAGPAAGPSVVAAGRAR